MNLVTKIYPQTIWGEKYQGNHEQLISEISTAGFNTLIAPVCQGSRLFFPDEKNDTESQWDMLQLQQNCHDAGIAFIPEFPLFHDPDTFNNIEQYRPVNSSGEFLESADWYKPICPSNSVYLQYRLNILIQAIKHFAPTIISLDFMHYPYLPGHAAFLQGENKLPNFCFCDFCQAKFQEFSGKMDPQQFPDYWLQFRQETITYVPVLIAEELERMGHQTKLMVQLPAIDAPGSINNLQFTTGMNLEQWHNIVDLLSPHLYTHQLQGENDWAQLFINEIQAVSQAEIIPELDVPFYAVEPEENIQAGELIEDFVDAGFAALSLYHWELLAENDILLDFLAELNA